MSAGMRLLDAMRAYCEDAAGCRHAALLNYLGEPLGGGGGGEGGGDTVDLRRGVAGAQP
jgi:hypothetical protein